MPEEAYIGIGSNLGDRVAACLSSLREIHRLPYTRVTAVSSLYETQPVETSSAVWFVNAAASLITDLPPRELLHSLLKIEKDVGRVRTEPGEPRPLDLDLLLYGRRIIMETGITIPHPRMISRRFVLEPLAEIAPGAVHPLLNKNVSTLLAELQDPHGVRWMQGVDLEKALSG